MVALPEVIAEAGAGNASFKELTSQGDNVYVNDAHATPDVIIIVKADFKIQ